MAVTYGFYNALNHDRLYDAIQMSSIFDGIIRDGIFSTIGDTMIVTAPEDGLYVNVGSGRAWFNHTWTLNDTDYPIEAEEAEVVLDRIDAVILEVNSSAEVRANSIKFLKGTPSSNPVKPTLTHNAEVNQYALAYVRIRAGQTTIFQSDIENAVGTDETPFITGVLQQVSIETLLKQWEAEFNTYFTNFKNTSTTEFNNWFATKVSEYTAWFAQMQTDMDSNFNEFDAWFQRMKDQLDENQAGHLQLQIDNLSGRIDDLDAEMPFAGGSKVNINFEYDVKPNIQYSNEHYKLTVGDTVRENNFSASKLHFDEYGILTVGDGILEVTYDVTDSITGKITHASYTYTINMPYFGRFVYNVTISASLYNYQGWLGSIGKDASSYSTIEDVFADEKLLRELMTRHASVDYLVEWLANNNEDAHTVLNNDYCAKWINLRDYALDMLYANPTVKAVMDEVDKYGYGEWALVGQVPKMTSNVAPSGRVVFSNNLINNSQAYLAFDGNETDSSRWHASKQDGTYIGYEFDEPKIIQAFRINADHSSTLGAYIKTFVIKGRNTDSESWVDLTDIITANDSKTSNVVTVGKMNSEGVAYKQIAVFPLSSYADEYWLYEVQFYAWQPKGNVPVMTSNTAPYGEVSSSSVYSGRSAYAVFADSSTTPFAFNSNSGWLTYKFTNPILVKKMMFENVSDDAIFSPKGFTVQASNDNSTWENLTTITNDTTAGKITYYDIPNTSYYIYYRISISGSQSSEHTYCHIKKLQFYGRQLNVSVPKMKSDTEPWGEASASSSQDAYKAFDSDDGTLWISTSTGIEWIQYKFNEKVIVKWAKIATNNNRVTKFNVQGSNDGTQWTTILEDTNLSTSTIVNITNNTGFQYYRLNCLTNGSNRKYNTGIATLQFYGLDYSEREFEEGSTMKYIYDHGVELLPLEYHQGSSSDVVKNSVYELYISKKTNTTSLEGRCGIGSKVDLTPYSLARITVGDMLTTQLTYSMNSQSLVVGGEAYVYLPVSDQSLPSNLVVDVSGVNKECYVAMVLPQDIGEATATELWLE